MLSYKVSMNSAKLFSQKAKLTVAVAGVDAPLWTGFRLLAMQEKGGGETK